MVICSRGVSAGSSISSHWSSGWPASLSQVDAGLLMRSANGGELSEGDSITVTAAERSARLVTFGGRDFHRVLRDKFGLSDR